LKKIYYKLRVKELQWIIGMKQKKNKTGIKSGYLFGLLHVRDIAGGSKNIYWFYPE
jgi:hypothetical protein